MARRNASNEALLTNYYGAVVMLQQAKEAHGKMGVDNTEIIDYLKALETKIGVEILQRMNGH